jgi:hypothetical protein
MLELQTFIKNGACSASGVVCGTCRERTTQNNAKQRKTHACDRTNAWIKPQRQFKAAPTEKHPHREEKTRAWDRKRLKVKVTCGMCQQQPREMVFPKLGEHQPHLLGIVD